jgi:hypothetical protein
MPATPGGSLTCPVCGLVLANEVEFAEHREVHSEQRAEGEPVVAMHHCSFCSASFRTPEELREHHRVAHNK